jgi:hypothetical protein
VLLIGRADALEELIEVVAAESNDACAALEAACAVE